MWLKTRRLIEMENRTYIVDIIIAVGNYENVANAAYYKISKYSHLGFVDPFIVGYHGSCHSGNGILQEDHNIPSMSWKKLKNSIIE